MDKKKNIPYKELKERLAPFINYEHKIQLNTESTVLNVSKMIQSHTAVLDANPGNKLYMPYYDRLVMLLTILEAGWE